MVFIVNMAAITFFCFCTVNPLTLGASNTNRSNWKLKLYLSWSCHIKPMGCYFFRTGLHTSRVISFILFFSTVSMSLLKCSCRQVKWSTFCITTSLIISHCCGMWFRFIPIYLIPIYRHKLMHGNPTQNFLHYSKLTDQRSLKTINIKVNHHVGGIISSMLITYHSADGWNLMRKTNFIVPLTICCPAVGTRYWHQ